MLFKISKRPFAWHIINENGKTVAKIKNKQLLGAAKNILDSGNHIVFTTDIINLPATKKDWNCAESRRYVVFQDKQAVATAKFSYAKTPDRTLIQKFFLRPPQVDEMNVETQYGTWFIKRQKDNSIIIKQNEKTLGIISPFFSFKGQNIEILCEYDPVFFAGIYMLTEYMMHEDDLIVV